MLFYPRSLRPYAGKILLQMKLTALLMLLASIHVFAGAGAQKISLTARNASLEQVFRQIGQQSRYLFVYDLEAVKKAAPVTVTVKDATIEQAMDLCLGQSPFSYTIVNNTVVLKPKKEEAVTEAIEVLIPPVNITGVVTNEDGQPQQAVSVVVKGTAKGTVTNERGEFSLSGVADDAVLVVSGVNIETVEIRVNGRTQLTVSVKTVVASLEETVVKGYYNTTKRTNTGTVSSINSNTIGAQPVLDPVAALQGRIPGLFVTASNGLPGSNFTVRLRGMNSLSAGLDPLYVVDGVPFFSEPLNQFTSANGRQSPFASINPADIERIDVLKDADATAIYGSRGANGVILITTKKGKSGKTTFSFNAYTGGSKVVNQLDMLNTPQYVALRKEAYANDNVVYDEDNAPDLVLWDQNKTTDWQDFMMGHTAKATEFQGSVSGGNAQTRFLLSGTYNKATTVMGHGLSFNRASAHFNLDHTTLDGKFNINGLISYTGTSDRSLASDLTTFYNLAPNYPLYDDEGQYYWFGNVQNPQAYFLRRSEVRTNNLIANSRLRYTILPGLDLKASLGYTSTDMNQMQLYPNATFNPNTSIGSMSYFGNSNAWSYIAEPQIDYNTNISQGKLQVLLGATWQQNKKRGWGVTANGFSSDALLEDMYSAASITSRPSSFAFYRYTALFGRANYNWEDKYIVNATFRRDGSTRFGPNNRFGNFGAVGAAWIFSSESFISSSFLSYGKLKGSYGTTGNDQIGDYGYLDSWSPTNFPIDGVAGLTPSRIPNLYYSWEETRKTELGLELGFVDNRILLNTNFYRNISDNQLVPFALSPQVGFPDITANFPATILNRGIEIELNTVNVQNRDFNWATSFNISFNHNELKKYPDFESSTYKDDLVVGEDMSIVKGFQFTGIDPATGTPTFQNFDDDPAISEPGDFVVLGKTMPDFFGGFQNTLSYKGLSLDFLFQFVKQEGSGVNYGYLSSVYGALANKDLSALDRWTKAGQITDIPRAATSSGNVDYTEYRLSSAVWGDASYIRLKNLSLSYDLSEISRKWKIDNLTVYVLGQNLLTITDYKGFDPETQGLFMPPLKTITAGLRFAF